MALNISRLFRAVSLGMQTTAWLLTTELADSDTGSLLQEFNTDDGRERADNKSGTHIAVVHLHVTDVGVSVEFVDQLTHKHTT